MVQGLGQCPVQFHSSALHALYLPVSILMFIYGIIIITRWHARQPPSFHVHISICVSIEFRVPTGHGKLEKVREFS